jgi:hypothetical protein
MYPSMPKEQTVSAPYCVGEKRRARTLSAWNRKGCCFVCNDVCERAVDERER